MGIDVCLNMVKCVGRRNMAFKGNNICIYIFAWIILDLKTTLHLSMKTWIRIKSLFNYVIFSAVTSTYMSTKKFIENKILKGQVKILWEMEWTIYSEWVKWINPLKGELQHTLIFLFCLFMLLKKYYI